MSIDEVTAAFKKEGFDVVVEDGSIATNEAPKHASFPFFIFCLALIKDVLDTQEFSIILIIVTKILSIMIAVIIALWMMFHFRGRWWRKSGLKVLGKLWIRFFGTAALEMIPFAGIFPWNTLFVLWAHNQEKKIVKIFDNLLRKLA